MIKLYNPDYSRANNLHQFTVENLNGEPVKLDKYKDFILVIVNVATKSPMTAMNYKVFNELMDKYGDKLRILAFPCNQFGQEEPGTSEEIAAHAEKNNVKFDVFAKVEVNGEQASAVWKYLKHCLAGPPRSGAVVKWSYTKFIISKNGIPIERIGPEVQLDKFEECLNKYIIT